MGQGDTSLLIKVGLWAYNATFTSGINWMYQPVLCEPTIFVAINDFLSFTGSCTAVVHDNHPMKCHQQSGTTETKFIQISKLKLLFCSNKTFVVNHFFFFLSDKVKSDYFHWCGQVDFTINLSKHFPIYKWPHYFLWSNCFFCFFLLLFIKNK